jgi:hypothetical protein
MDWREWFSFHLKIVWNATQGVYDRKAKSFELLILKQLELWKSPNQTLQKLCCII